MFPLSLFAALISCGQSVTGAQGFVPPATVHHIETHFKQRVEATLTTSCISPQTVGGFLKVYAPVPPTLPMQRLVSCDLRCRKYPDIAPTRVVDVKNPLQQYMYLNIPVSADTLSDACVVDMKYVVDLYSAKLVSGKGIVDDTTIPTKAVTAFTSESSRNDFRSPPFQTFLTENSLRKHTGESTFDFANRAYQYLAANMHYVGHPFDGNASTFCRTLSGDCGVHAIMSASILAANGLTVATLAGRFAVDERPDFGQFHCFNAFFEDGVGWITFDAGYEFGSVDGNFIAFNLTADDCPQPNITRCLDQFMIWDYNGVSPYRPKYEDHWHVKNMERPRQGMVEIFDDFEDGYKNWRIEGNAFGESPAGGTFPNQQRVSGFSSEHLVNTFLAGDAAQGAASSRYFKISHRYIRFLIGGGRDPDRLALQLVVDGRVVRTATGNNSEDLEDKEWDVSSYIGSQAYFRIIDLSSGAWGHILVDAIGFADRTMYTK